MKWRLNFYLFFLERIISVATSPIAATKPMNAIITNIVIGEDESSFSASDNSFEIMFSALSLS